MEDLFSEPNYSERFKSLIFQDSPFYRVFYDSWMSVSYFKSKAAYSKKFLPERPADSILASFADSEILKSSNLFTASACALLGYLFVALRVYGIKGDDGRIRKYEKLIDFAARANEELLSIPYRGSNRLLSTVDEATTSPSSTENILIEDSKGVTYIPYFAPALLSAAIVAALGVRLLLLPKKD